MAGQDRPALDEWDVERQGGSIGTVGIERGSFARIGPFHGVRQERPTDAGLPGVPSHRQLGVVSGQQEGSLRVGDRRSRIALQHDLGSRDGSPSFVLHLAGKGEGRCGSGGTSDQDQSVDVHGSSL